MKDIKLSFPYPSTSRHNLSQDVALSLSMGMVIPVRTVEVLPGDSHRIATSFSLVSNPLVKPLLQGVMLRYCRFWVPRRIYHYGLRANNTDYDPQTANVRYSIFENMRFPYEGSPGAYKARSTFQQSSLFDYLGYSAIGDNFGTYGMNFNRAEFGPIISVPSEDDLFRFNVEPYIGYIDICRNYFADSATNMIAWTCYSHPDGQPESSSEHFFRVAVCPLGQVDSYIDNIQNDTALGVEAFRYGTGGFILSGHSLGEDLVPDAVSGFNGLSVGRAHVGFCVPLNRPDRLSRLFDLTPLSSQNALVSSSEISISNLSFLSKLQRYLTRKFFGGTRYTDVMYSIFGQRVPHVDSPILLDVFDYEIGSELVSSTNASETQNPGILGGYFSSSGVLSTSSGSSRRRYSFNEAGYIMDLVYIMPRLFRAAFVPDYVPIDHESLSFGMAQGNFVPDMNGIGWQQPAFGTYFRLFNTITDSSTAAVFSKTVSPGCEPSWQQYRTLPDVCRGAFNPLRSIPSEDSFSLIDQTQSINSPLYVFTDRANGNPTFNGNGLLASASASVLASMLYTDPTDFNRIFGTDELTFDNIFAVFRYAHQAKRQVTKRFTLTFA